MEHLALAFVVGLVAALVLFFVLFSIAAPTKVRLQDACSNVYELAHWPIDRAGAVFEWCLPRLTNRQLIGTVFADAGAFFGDGGAPFKILTEHPMMLGALLALNLATSLSVRDAEHNLRPYRPYTRRSEAVLRDHAVAQT